MVASLSVRRFHAHRSRLILSLVAAALALAGVLAQAIPPLLAFVPVAFAMGAMNMMFEVKGEVRIGLTYMTGTLVKFGHRLALALVGEERWGWLPYFVLWSGLVGGALLGASACHVMGALSLWPCAIAALVLAFCSPCVAGDRDR